MKLKYKRDSRTLEDELFPEYKIVAWHEYRRLELTPEQARRSFGDDMVDFFMFMDQIDEQVKHMVEIVRQTGLTIDEVNASLAQWRQENFHDSA